MSRKLEIQTAAQRLFKKHGYAVASMRDIASEMDMEAASLYNHIESKEEILYNICFGLANKLNNAIEEVNDIYFNSEEKLRMAVKFHIETLCEDLDAAYVFVHDWKYLTGQALKDFKASRDMYENGIRTIVEGGEKEGLFEENNKGFATLTILSSLNWIVEWYKTEGRLSPKEIAEKLSDFILTGLKKEKL